MRTRSPVGPHTHSATSASDTLVGAAANDTLSAAYTQHGGLPAVAFALHTDTGVAVTTLTAVSASTTLVSATVSGAAAALALLSTATVHVAHTAMLNGASPPDHASATLTRGSTVGGMFPAYVLTHDALRLAVVTNHTPTGAVTLPFESWQSAATTADVPPPAHSPRPSNVTASAGAPDDSTTRPDTLPTNVGVLPSPVAGMPSPLPYTSGCATLVTFTRSSAHVPDPTPATISASTGDGHAATAPDARPAGISTTRPAPAAGGATRQVGSSAVRYDTFTLASDASPAHDTTLTGAMSTPTSAGARHVTASSDTTLTGAHGTPPTLTFTAGPRPTPGPNTYITCPPRTTAGTAADGALRSLLLTASGVPRVSAVTHPPRHRTDTPPRHSACTPLTAAVQLHAANDVLATTSGVHSVLPPTVTPVSRDSPCASTNPRPVSTTLPVAAAVVADVAVAAVVLRNAVTSGAVNDALLLEVPPRSVSCMALVLPSRTATGTLPSPPALAQLTTAPAAGK